MSFPPIEIEGLLSPQTCRLAAAYARTLKKTGRLLPDPQVPGAPARYGDPLMDAILAELTPTVAQAIGEAVRPTYSYFRVYGPGDELPPHTDRPACEVSVSICLARSGPNWPLYVRFDGHDMPFEGGPGTGLLYAGPEHTHWRQAYEGQEQIQVFIHYVRAAGPHAIEATDKRTALGVGRRPDRLTGDVSRFVMVLDDVLPNGLARAIIDTYEPTDLWEPGAVGEEAQVDPSQRLCEVVRMSQDRITQGIAHRKALDNAVFQVVGKVGTAYCERFPEVKLKTDTGYNLMRYKPGGFYREHVDHFEQMPRTLSMSLFLNDDYDGGALSFNGGEFAVAPQAARAVVFPSNFMFPHQVVRVENGTRYAVVTWFL